MRRRIGDILKKVSAQIPNFITLDLESYTAEDCIKYKLIKVGYRGALFIDTRCGELDIAVSVR